MRHSRTLLRRAARPLAGLLLAAGGALACLAQAPAGAPRARIFDAYKYEAAEGGGRFDRFAAQLKREPQARAYVIAYAARVRPFNGISAELLLGWTRHGLEARGIRPDRVVAVDGGLRDEPFVELWVVPPGAAEPRPRPTAAPGDVVYCPYIYVYGEQYVFRPKTPLEFRARFGNAAPDLRPTFEWSVRGGRIVSGQGTDTVAVEPEAARVVAAVEMGGLSPECQDDAMEATVVGVAPHRFDEYGNVRIGDEKARLDNLAINLQREPELRAYLIAYSGRRGRRAEGETRAARAKDYLVNTRGVNPEQVVTVDGGYRDELTLELWLSPAGGRAPEPSPSVDEKYVGPRRRRR